MIIKYLSVYKEVDACCMLWQEAIDCMHVLIKRFYFSWLLAQSDNRFFIIFFSCCDYSSDTDCQARGGAQTEQHCSTSPPEHELRGARMR